MALTVKSKLLLSTGIIAFATMAMILYTYAPRDPLGGFFKLVSVWMISSYIAIWAGILLFMARLLKWVKPDSLLYLLMGLFNLLSGMLAVILFFYHKTSVEWLHHFLLNCLAGVILLGDTCQSSLKEKPTA